jgi:hypothetical protein
MNIGGVADWDGNVLFADAMKSSRTWDTPDNTWTLLPASSLDAQGWPTVDAEIIVWAGLTRDNSGTYALSCQSNGPVTITPRLASASLQNVAYNSGTGVTTAQIVLTSSTDDSFCLRFTGTVGGVKNVKLMRPIAPGSSVSQAFTEDFSRPFLNAIVPVHALRFMDYLATNGSLMQHWADRLPADRASQNQTAGGHDTGGSWEYIIKLCNQTHKDGWIDIPLLADDDYIHQLAKLIRDGNAFTAPLDSSVKLYIEYANEVWNTGGGFDGNRNHDLAVQDQQGGDPYGYNFDNCANDWFWAWRRTARRALDISRIFRQELGDARMLTQIRPVFEWQLGYAFVGYDPLNYLESAYIPKVAPGMPISYFFYAGGGSAYYNPDNSSDTLTLANFWQSATMDVAAWTASSILPADAEVCATFGIKRMAYEGGPSLDNLGHSESVKAQAWSDLNMKTAMLDHHAAWSQWGGDLFMYYTLRPHDYQWGFFTTIDDLTHPKYQALVQLATAARAAVSNGRPVAVPVNGNSYDLKNWFGDTFGSSVTFSSNQQWVSYVFNVPLDAIYQISVAYPTGTSGAFGLLFDGVPANTITASGSGTVSSLVTWTKGLHSVRVKTTGGAVTVNSVNVSVSGITDTTPPSAPGTPVASDITLSGLTLTWPAATDNYAVSAYRVYRDGTLIGTVAVGTTFHDAGLLPLTAYTYTVVAVDIAGNLGPASAPCQASTTNSSQPVSGNTVTATATVAATANRGNTGNKVIIYPNPCNRSIIPALFFENLPGQSTVWIYNLAGQLVGKLDNLGSQAGWNVSNTAPGVYFYVVKYPGGKQQGKLCVLK